MPLALGLRRTGERKALTKQPHSSTRQWAHRNLSSLELTISFGNGDGGRCGERSLARALA